MAIRFLCGFEVAEHAERIVLGSGGQETAGDLYQIARPHQVIAAEIFVSLIKSPGDGEAGDDASDKFLGLVGPQHAGADAVEIVLSRGLIQFQQTVLPVLPMPHVMLAEFIVGLTQAGPHLLAGFRPDAPETQRQHEFSRARLQINLAGKSDVAIHGAGVVPGQAEIAGKILPAIGIAGKAHRRLLPGSGAAKCQSRVVAVGEKHRHAFVVAEPSGVARPVVRKVRGEQRIEPIVGEGSLQWDKTHFLQYDVAVGIGENFFFDPIAAALAGVHKFIHRNAGFKGMILEGAMTFFFRKEIYAVGDDESQIARACLIDAREIHFVENAVAQGEPHAAVQIQGSAYAAFGAGGPARGNSGPAGSVTFRVTHIDPSRCHSERSLAAQSAGKRSRRISTLYQR